MKSNGKDIANKLFWENPKNRESAHTKWKSVVEGITEEQAIHCETIGSEHLHNLEEADEIINAYLKSLLF